MDSIANALHKLMHMRKDEPQAHVYTCWFCNSKYAKPTDFLAHLKLEASDNA